MERLSFEGNATMCFTVQFRKENSRRFETERLFYCSQQISFFVVVVVVVASLQPTRQTEVSTITATPVQQQAAELQSQSNIDVFGLKLVCCVFALYRVAYLRPHPHEDVFISRFENVQFGREETETSAHTTETLLSATVAVTYWLLEIK